MYIPMIETTTVRMDIPELAGKVCERVFIERFAYKGELIDPCNALLLKYAGEENWHRLRVEASGLFWRELTSAQMRVYHTELSPKVDYPLIDLGRAYCVEGARLQSVKMEEQKIGRQDLIQFQLTFANQRFILLRCVVRGYRTRRLSRELVLGPISTAGISLSSFTYRFENILGNRKTNLPELLSPLELVH